MSCDSYQLAQLSTPCYFEIIRKEREERERREREEREREKLTINTFAEFICKQFLGVSLIFFC
jgi:hypothetical protein